MIRTLIVDDEPLARARLRRLLGEFADVEIVGESGDGRDAVLAVERDAPDLVLLDVQMPELNGFEVLAALPPEHTPAIVFVTAYDEFALRAFDVHAVDYLLKPVDAERLARALERVRATLRRRADAAPDERLIALLRELRTRPAYLDRVAVRVDQRLLLVRTPQIDWIEGEGNYVRLHIGKQSLLMREKMGVLENRLDPGAFVRIHRSTIVNLERVAVVEPLIDGDFVFVLADGRRLTSTRMYRDRVREVLGRFRP